MQKTLSSSLLIALAIAASPAGAKGVTQNANEAATARHYAALIAGAAPKTAELTLFFSQMPKGGDLHHHYSGALYAETYINWLDQEGYCVYKQTNEAEKIEIYRVETDPNKVKAELAKPDNKRTCLSSADVLRNDGFRRELLQRWSSKDFTNHGAIQPPPDSQFFNTFGYFGAVSNENFQAGLAEIKNRAVKENVSYIETMLKSVDIPNSLADRDFDDAAWKSVNDDAALDAQMRARMQVLKANAEFGKSVADFVDLVDKNSAGIDDDNFTMRYQTYVVRLFAPSKVFASMLAGFEAASKDSKIVGVNIVGQESAVTSMRDYLLHMKMFRFLKSIYPNVNIDLHAGELALGDVPPEGLQFHIDQALNIAGAQRIGHGIDLAHESNAVGILKEMREKDIPVEINLTSNAFIEGVQGENHPITLYRRYGVPYVISTDDAGVTRHNLSNEYVLFASRYKPSYAELKKAAYNSIRYSFLPAADKARLTRQLNGRFAHFESEIAELDRSHTAHK